MKASELMARAENALRTGQTENLFPVIARRCLVAIRDERQANRRPVTYDKAGATTPLNPPANALDAVA